MTDEIKQLYLRALASDGVDKYIRGKVHKAGVEVLVDLITEKITVYGKIKCQGFTKSFFLENMDG